MSDLCAIDDGEMLAYMHYLLVHPAYRHQGIANRLVEAVKEKYKNYLYINISPEESKNAAFYRRFGFEIMPDGVAMQICNFADKR